MKQYKTRLARTAMTLLIALLTTTTAWAQSELTLYDGTGTNSYIPMYGYYADYGTRSQFVLPATDLTDLQGASIEKLTFYSSSASVAWGSSTFKVYVKEVDYNSFASNTFEDWNTMTEVFTGSLAISGTQMVITFDTPYPYGGNNMLIGFHEIEFGTASSIISWYGVSQNSNTALYNNASMSHVWSSTVNKQQFLPTVTIGYTPGNGVAYPTTLTATNVTAHEAKLTWTGGTSTYNVEYKKVADPDWTRALTNTSLTTHTLTGLTLNTDYQARVQSVSGNDLSIWRTVNFKTLISCPAPTDLAVTLTPGDGSVATLTWTENGTATKWEICLNNDEENLRIVTSDQCSMLNGQWSIKLTGLTAEQAYTAKIRAVNNVDDKSEWTDAISFTPTNAYLFTVNDGTATSQYVPVYGYYADYQQRAEFIIPASELAALSGKTLTSMKFYANYDFTSTGSFQVYVKEVSEEAFSGTDFYTAEEATTVYTGTVTVSSTDGMTINFSEDFDYGDGNLLVGFYQANGGGNYSQSSSNAFYGEEATGASISYYSSYSADQRNFLPKVTFGYLNNSYKKPKSLTLGAITNNTATIGWTAPSDDVTGYQYQYKPEGGSWTELASTTETSTTLTGLTGNTTYTFQVKAIYSNGESAFTHTTFTTECNAYVIPYDYSFEDVGDMDCWTISDVYERTIIDNGSTITSASARTGDKFFAFEYYNYPDTDPQYMTLITPELTGIENALRVEFYYRTSGDYEETFRVGYSTTDKNLSSFTWGSPTSSTATEYQLFKANYPAGTKYVAVQHLSDDKDFLILDDFSFTEAPSCLEPTNILTSSITTTSAKLSWTAGGSETAWDIYVTDDFDNVPNDETTPTYAGVTSNVNYPLSGLVSGTTYYVYVRSACDETEHSEWSNRATFNTVCEGLALPYSYDFEDDALPVCWSTISTNEGWNIFSISDSDPQHGSKHLNMYCQSSNQYQYLVLPVVDGSYPLNEYEITFYSKLAGTNTYGRTLAVGVMTDPTDATTFVQVGEVFTPTTAYAQYKVRLNTYTGSGQYIAIKHTISNIGQTFIDNLEVNHLPSCLEPEDLAVSNITGHTADLNWMGYSDAYKVNYRTSAYMDGVEESFDTSSIPSGWTMYTGKLADVMSNPDKLASATSGWYFGSNNGVFDSHARVNIYSNNQKWLVTPAVTIPENGGLSFDLALTAYSGTNVPAPATTGTDDKFIVLISTDDKATWTILRQWDNKEGSTYVYNNIANTATGENVSIDLSSYAGQSVNIAFYGESTETNADNNLHIDNVVIGAFVAEGEWQTATADEEHCTLTDLAAETEYEVRLQGNCGSTDGTSEWSEVLTFTTDVACVAPTGLAASNMKSERVDLSWVSGADAWKICVNDDNLVTVTIDDVTINEGTVTYTFENLTPATSYTVKVQGDCGSLDGLSEWSNTVNFTTLTACPVPTDVAVTDIEPNSATVNWTGDSESYTVKYRTAACVDGLGESFDTSSIPSGWTMYTGKLADVMSNPDKLASATSGWYFGSNNGVFDSHARVNIYSNNQKWLVTPAVTIPENGGLSFDLALTAYSGSNVPAPQTTGTDDKFIVLISTDDKATWTILRQWDNEEGSTYVYNNIANTATGENVSINLSSYAGQSAYIAFYGESTVSNADNNLHIDNVAIGTPIAAGEWQSVSTAGAETTAHLTGLIADTKYDVKVVSSCEDKESDVVSFTTPISIAIADAGTDNRTVIAANNGKTGQVTLTGRTLYKDNNWNTLCLPFSIANINAEDSPLNGAIVRELNDASISGSTLTLNFKNATTAIKAGTPYIVMWEVTSSSTITDPVFSGVTIDKTVRNYDNDVSGDTRVRFLGTYDKISFTSDNRSILFLGEENTLYWPQSGATIGACRAYFKIGEDGEEARLLTGFNLNFGDEETSGIITTDFTDRTDATWFTIDGKKLDKAPTRKGLYIRNGHKVVIK